MGEKEFTVTQQITKQFYELRQHLDDRHWNTDQILKLIEMSRAEEQRERHFRELHGGR